MKSKFLTWLIIMASLLSCKKNEDVSRMQCEETFCSQPWSAERKWEVERKVKEFFKEKDVKVYEVIVKGDRDNPYGDCFCRTGRTIEISVHADDKQVVEKEGFLEK